MRFFKREGNVKFRNTTDEKVVKIWLEQGFVEINSSGVVIDNPKNKKKKSKKKKDK